MGGLWEQRPGTGIWSNWDQMCREWGLEAMEDEAEQVSEECRQQAPLGLSPGSIPSSLTNLDQFLTLLEALSSYP